jgi:hypothetical protein
LAVDHPGAVYSYTFPLVLVAIQKVDEVHEIEFKLIVVAPAEFGKSASVPTVVVISEPTSINETSIALRARTTNMGTPDS